MGKTTYLRKTLEALNPNRYVVIYICMTTITAIDFYRMLNNALGLEETTKKSQMFKQIQGINEVYKERNYSEDVL